MSLFGEESKATVVSAQAIISAKETAVGVEDANLEKKTVTQSMERKKEEEDAKVMKFRKEVGLKFLTNYVEFKKNEQSQIHSAT